MYLLVDLFRLATALALFLAGLRFVAQGLRPLIWNRAGSLFAGLKKGGWSAFAQGMIISFSQQSSIRGSILTSALIQCDVTDLANGILALAGNCLGALPVVFIAVFARSLPDPWPVFLSAMLLTCGITLAAGHRYHAPGLILSGLGLTIMGIYTGMFQISGYHMAPGLSRLFTIVGASSVFSLTTGILFGVLLQSGLGTMALLQLGAATGILSLKSGVFLVAGLVLGAVLPVLRSASEQARKTQRIAAARILYSLTGTVPWCILSLVLFKLFPDTGAYKATVLDVALLYFVVNATGVALTAPFYRQAASLLEKVLPDEPDQDTGNPSLALQQFPVYALKLISGCQLELKQKAIQQVNLATACLLERRGLVQLEETVQASDQLQKQCWELISVLGTTPLIFQEQSELKYDILVLENFRQMAKSCLALARLSSGIVEYDFQLQAGKDIRALAGQCLATLNQAFDKNSLEAESAGRDKMEIITSLMREGHLQRLVQGRSSPEKELLFLQAVDLYELIASQAREAARAGKEMELWKQS